MTVLDDAPLGRRERKKLQTRRALRSGALALFAAQGFEATTIEEITDAADVAPRTFFLHFASKEDVLLADSRNRLAAMEEALAEQPHEMAPLDAVRAAMSSGLALGGLDYETVRLAGRLMDESPTVRSGHLQMYASFEQAISRDVAARTGLDAVLDVYPRLLAASVTTALRVCVATWYQRGGAGDLDAILDEAFARLAAGFSAA